MRCTIVGAPVQDGAGRMGCEMGPSALRTAGLAEVLSGLGHSVEDMAVQAIPVRRVVHGNLALKALPEVSAWTSAIAEAAYVASKHGVLGLVRSTAIELARTGVTVNAVCPGYVDTPMTDATVRGIVEKTGRSAEEARAVLERKQPTGRLVTTDEVAEAVWACVANPGITGQGINVDGGAVQS